jgi:5'-3' exonuclease
MGIPAFFRQIVTNYPKTHTAKLEKKIDYFFIDFNSIIYDVFHKLTKDNTEKMTNSKFETTLINKVVQKVMEMVQLIEPQKLFYMALDGSAPRAKMVQQRWRRFKGVKDEEYFRELKKVHAIEQSPNIWSPSSNIAPGTKFMKKLSAALKKKIDSGDFSTHQKDLKIILSDGNIPGEGEHKFLPIIREMEQKDDTICIYSPDADMIVLSMAVKKNNIWIMQKMKSGNETPDAVKNYLSEGYEFIFLSIDEYKDVFIETLGITGEKKEIVRLITDYVFLTFLGGNDFVMAIPYLLIRKEPRKGSNAGGLNILLNVYQQLLPNEKDYLVIIQNGKYTINHLFLLHIFENISKSEDYYMRGIQMNINRVKNEGKGDDLKLEKEADMTPYEKDVSRYEHFEYYSKLHPQYDKYEPIFEKFDFIKPKNVWKPIYYQHFFNLNQNILPEYNNYRSKICLNYLESLMFTLKYYFEGIPSWTWYYRFRAPPTMSDLCVNLGKYVKNINDIKFEIGEPYKPFDQLMLILPPQMGHLLPKSYEKLMKNELLQYYPIDFELDVFLGGKHIYSEPILPNIDDKHILSETDKIVLTAEEKTRNIVNDKPYMRDSKTVKIKIKKVII